MFGTKRLAKRSIVGTQVAAKWQDGRYYPGVIECEYCEESPFTDAIYNVKFEDGYQKNINAKNIIGPGFQTNNSVVLKNGQKVFLTLNGREVTGLVIRHNLDADQVLINAQLCNGNDAEVTKRTEELRLLKSRKSARLADQDTDYSKLADLQLSEAKRRTVSSRIDVPNKQRYRQSHTQDVQETDDSNMTIVEDDDDSDVEMMDENIAAMVLTSLSCSPHSPQYTHQEFKDFNKTGPLSSSACSSGYHSNQSERSDRSPPTLSHLSESAPAATGMMFSLLGQDDCLDLEEGRSEGEISPERKRVTKRTMYQCTWPGCLKVSSTCEAIEKHVRDLHLGSAMKEKDDSDTDSCGEEEFYYTEIEVNMENVTQGFSDMCSSSNISPPVVSTEPTSFVIPDHDYQKKEFRHSFASSVPSGSTFTSPARAMPIPIKVNEIQRSLSWQNTHSYATSPSPPIRLSTKLSTQERLQQHQAQSPKIHMIPVSKALSIHKKPRSEVRKCRKVYGMENRDMWCTQCKWKKACTRFLE